MKLRPIPPVERLRLRLERDEARLERTRRQLADREAKLQASRRAVASKKFNRARLDALRHMRLDSAARSGPARPLAGERQ